MIREDLRIGILTIHEIFNPSLLILKCFLPVIAIIIGTPDESACQKAKHHK